ncbi:hypothetical protein CBR_g26313 [Chara braunii]|uniref:Uncharacterized protein n=1 Tax=Chara braunii TaxID=69332 RepID=A0A388L7R0_CHABU|nr:hypothetical protein CBR_g26313 [Chara braunii]|eukprot:GBG78282.1 hypothetical protein CBR_g26313 [Chara braunii]
MSSPILPQQTRSGNRASVHVARSLFNAVTQHPSGVVPVPSFTSPDAPSFSSGQVWRRPFIADSMVPHYAASHDAPRLDCAPMLPAPLPSPCDGHVLQQSISGAALGMRVLRQPPVAVQAHSEGGGQSGHLDVVGGTAALSAPTVAPHRDPSRSAESCPLTTPSTSSAGGTPREKYIYLSLPSTMRMKTLKEAVSKKHGRSVNIGALVDRLLFWSLPSIRLEYGDDVGDSIERSLPASAKATVFRFDDAVASDSSVEIDTGDDCGSACAAGDASVGGGLPSHRFQGSRRHGCRGRPPGRSQRGGRSAGLTKRRMWFDGVDGNENLGPMHERGDVLRLMSMWDMPNKPDLVFMEPVKLLQLLGLFDLRCPSHGAAGLVDVESISYPAHICCLRLTCTKGCVWAWNSCFVKNEVWKSRVEQQLFHSAVSTGTTYTVLNSLCTGLGMKTVNKGKFYKFFSDVGGTKGGWNTKTVKLACRFFDAAIRTVMEDGKPVTLMIDGRYDSSRSSQHCTVTAMDFHTRLIVGIVTLRPKYGGKASSQLEPPAVMRLLQELEERGLATQEVVTDDCQALGPGFREKGLRWQKDVWHKVKNLARNFSKHVKLGKATKKKNLEECETEAQIMQMNKEDIVVAHDRLFPNEKLTPKQRRSTKPVIVDLVFKKMYPEGNARASTRVVDPDGVSEYHLLELRRWFMKACELSAGEGLDDASTLASDIHMLVDHWAGDHSRCVGERQALCEVAGGPCRLPMFSIAAAAYKDASYFFGRQCSVEKMSHYTLNRATSAVETFHANINKYCSKRIHFEKSYDARVCLAALHWNCNAWRDPIDFVPRIPAGTSIRQRPGHMHNNQPVDLSW